MMFHFSFGGSQVFEPVHFFQHFSILAYIGGLPWLDAVDEDFAFVAVDFNTVISSCFLQLYQCVDACSSGKQKSPQIMVLRPRMRHTTVSAGKYANLWMLGCIGKGLGSPPILCHVMRAIGGETRTNRKPTNDCPTSANAKLCPICQRLALVSMLNYVLQFEPKFGVSVSHKGRKLYESKCLLTLLFYCHTHHKPILHRLAAIHNAADRHADR